MKMEIIRNFEILVDRIMKFFEVTSFKKSLNKLPKQNCIEEQLRMLIYKTFDF